VNGKSADKAKAAASDNWDITNLASKGNGHGTEMFDALYHRYRSDRAEHEDSVDLKIESKNQLKIFRIGEGVTNH